jgi:predicted dithiol-disulfide oxidoreductase (DUF899 family)
MRWMTDEPKLNEGKDIWIHAQKVSADEISAYANLRRLTEQREALPWLKIMNAVYSISSICKKQPKNMHIIN